MIDPYLESSDCVDIWQASLHFCCRDACQVQTQSDDSKYRSRTNKISTRSEVRSEIAPKNFIEKGPSLKKKNTAGFLVKNEK